MVRLENYYECDPEERDPSTPERYPVNHVRYSRLLKAVEWIDRAHRAVGSRAYTLKDAMLREFDSAAPLDEVLGTREELDQNRALIESFADGIDSNPFISTIGRYSFKRSFVDFLKTRRRVLRFYHSDRAFIEASGSFTAPLIITGVARSGTTLLQRLISEDPNTRSPYTFELERPLPPLKREADTLTDPRIEESNAFINSSKRLAPGFLEKFSESHLLSATEMEESFIFMLAHNGITVVNAPQAGRRYLEQMLTYPDKATIFRYERLFFKTLDAYRPARSHWTLKAPAYAPCFPLIFQEYPDARVVVTHRNPLVTLPSCCRLTESWCIASDRDGTFDKHRFAQFVEPIVEKCLMVPLTYRQEHPDKEDRIFDCMYAGLFADPIAMVKKVYRTFGLEYTDEFERRMKVYLENNRQGKYGRHRYSLEEYGLDAEHYHQKYRAYMDRYGYGIPNREAVRPTSMGAAAPLG